MIRVERLPMSSTAQTASERTAYSNAVEKHESMAARTRGFAPG